MFDIYLLKIHFVTFFVDIIVQHETLFSINLPFCAVLEAFWSCLLPSKRRNSNSSAPFIKEILLECGTFYKGNRPVHWHENIYLHCETVLHMLAHASISSWMKSTKTTRKTVRDVWRWSSGVSAFHGAFSFGYVYSGPDRTATVPNRTGWRYRILFTRDESKRFQNRSCCYAGTVLDPSRTGSRTVSCKQNYCPNSDLPEDEATLKSFWSRLPVFSLYLRSKVINSSIPPMHSPATGYENRLND